MTDGEGRLSPTADDTERIGEQLATRLRPGDVLLLEGDLAAGKTTLVRGLLRGLGGDPDDVTSPSFVLLQSYPCASGGIRRLHHVDLYRLADSLADLREIGLDEVLSEADAVVAVEWPRDTIARWIPDDAGLWRVRLRLADGETREVVTLRASSHPETPVGNGGVPDAKTSDFSLGQGNQEFARRRTHVRRTRKPAD